jgi:hypothetical protein
MLNPKQTKKKNNETKFNKNNENSAQQCLDKNDDLFTIKKSSKSLKSQKFEPMKFLSNINSNIKNNNNSLSGPIKGESDPEKQLLYYFKDKRIYIEIYNGNINSSSTFYNILLKYKIIQCKKLSKKIDYIVFKDGHLKTKKYAVLKGIKMVNPLWIDDKVNNHIFKDDKEYEIKTNFGDIILREKYENDKLTEETNSNKKDDTLIEDKNFELELEAEYDTEYANLVDKMRENNSLSVLSTINLTNKEEEEVSFKDGSLSININNINKDSDLVIKRRKRKSSNKRRTLLFNEENGNNMFNESNNLTKMNDKKGGKKQKKKLSENNSKKNNKQKKIESNDKNNNNYIIELDQNNGNTLSLAKKNEKEIKVSSSSSVEKINIMTYKLEQNEIQCLKSLNNFEYKGNLNNNNDKDKFKDIYNISNIIILDKNKSLYDWKLYEFLLDKKIIIDFTLFLFEFISGDIVYNNMDELIEKINQISMNNEFYYFNKKIRLQKRSMMQSLTIVDNLISKERGDSINQQINENENKFYFLLNKDIPDDEKKILQKLLKNYLKANIININLPKKRPKSVANQINNNLKKIEKRSKKFNLEVIKESNNIKNDENKINEEKENIAVINDETINKSKNTTIKDEPNIEGTYLISKEKVNSINFLKKVKYYKGVISQKYVYDSFLNGQLLDLNDKSIFEKYQLQ